MHITHLKKSIAGWLLVITSMLLIEVSVQGAEQEFKTLELVRTYQSEADIHAAYPEYFPNTASIQIHEGTIQFLERQTGTVRTQIRTQHFAFEVTAPLTEAERQQASEPIIRDAVSRRLSNNKTLLLVREGKVQIEPSGYIGTGSFTPTQNLLYNAYGEIVTELPLEVNMIAASPQTGDFVAYNWAEFGGPPSIYFYSSDGTLLQRQEIFEKAQVRFSQSGEFVQVYSQDSRIFFIFTKTGELVYQGDYTELIHDLNPLLWGVFVSDQAELILLATSGKISLYTIQGKALWDIQSREHIIREVCFFSQRDVVAIKILNRKIASDANYPNYYNVQIHSLKTGEMIDEIIGVAEIASINDRLIVNKGGQYYEYQIR